LKVEKKGGLKHQVVCVWLVYISYLVVSLASGPHWSCYIYWFTKKNLFIRAEYLKTESMQTRTESAIELFVSPTTSISIVLSIPALGVIYNHKAGCHRASYSCV